MAVATPKGTSAVAPLVEQIGPQIQPTEVREALLADVVALAVPFEAVRGLVESVPDWNQRIIIDATNAIDYKDFSPADLGGRPSSDQVAEWADGGRRVAFISGNDPNANAEIAKLAVQFGFVPIDLGWNDAGGLLHSFGGPLTGHSFVSQPLVGNSPAEMDLADRR